MLFATQYLTGSDLTNFARRNANVLTLVASVSNSGESREAAVPQLKIIGQTVGIVGLELK